MKFGRLKTEKMLFAIELDFWRKAAGKSNRDGVTNDKIREMMDVIHTIVKNI